MSASSFNPVLLAAMQPVETLLEQQAQNIIGLEAAAQQLQSQIATLNKRKSFYNLQQCPLFTADKKIPYQWIQPGNSGNTGGASSLTHGTCSMTLQTDGSSIVKVNPVKLPNGASDDFLFYMVLPYPYEKPNNFGFDCSRFNAASPTDWSNSQQLEFWDELIDDGFQYTMNWAANHQGLFYFDRSKPNGGAWIPYMPLGKPILMDLSKPTDWSFTASIDRNNHTVLYETLTCGGIEFDVEKTCNAVPKAGKQFSTSIQMDGKASGAAYSAVLDNLNVYYW